jgi:hypothetical protein
MVAYEEGSAYPVSGNFDLIAQYEHFFNDPLAPKTVVVAPSLTLDPEILGQIAGHVHYEERMLCLLLLLRMPATRVIYVTSMPIDEAIVDYYLHLLSGVTARHARRRLTLLACYDGSNRSLTRKILERPRLIARIRENLPPGQLAHLTGFNITPLEEALAEKLGIPIYGCPSALAQWGTKSGSRELFRRAGVPMPPGFEHLRTPSEVGAALSALKREFPWLKKAMVKLNDGFSGDGNAIFTYPKQVGEIAPDQLAGNLKVVAATLSYALFMEKLAEMGGIVEAFVDGESVDGADKESPSVQCRITPVGEVEVISTHDQVLDDQTGQVYLGASFPARAEYAAEIGEMGRKIAIELRGLGALGRFGVDFMSVRQEGRWVHYAIEINLRKGGTTHPYLMLYLLTGGRYVPEEGMFYTPQGRSRYYFTTDNLQAEAYKTLTPEDLIDWAICRRLHFDGTTQEGVLFHLLGALPQYGKLGVLCIGQSPEHARALYEHTVQLLNEATQNEGEPGLG